MLRAAETYCVGASMKSLAGPQSESTVVDPLTKTPGHRVVVGVGTAPGKVAVAPFR
jgi:hypothetical protein